MDFWRYYHGICLEDLKKASGSLRISCVQAEIVTQLLPNTCTVRYLLTNQLSQSMRFSRGV
jgi:hypothetical protein